MRIVLFILVTGLFQAALASADVDNGYFKVVRGGAAHVFIKTVKTAVADPLQAEKPLVESTRYGLIVDRGTKNAALFRIETLEDETQSWIQIFQGSNGLLTAEASQNASYSGLVTKRGSSTVLTLTPTKFGESIGCGGVIESRGSDAMKWGSLPKSGGFEGRNGRLDVTPKLIAGRFVIDGKELNGIFSIEPFIDGLVALRTKDIDPEASSGRSIDQTIAAVAASIRHRDRVLGVFNDDYTELLLITLKPGQMNCYSSSSGINND